MEILRSYINETIYLFNEMSPYLLLGFLIAGLLYVYFPPRLVGKYLGSKGLKSVIYAAILGIPLPLCSCGVIPTGVSFYRTGASKGASVSFFISTPQTGVDSIAVTYSLMGLPFALIRPFIALATGIAGGFFADRADQKDNRDKAVDVEQEAPVTGRNAFVRMMKYAFGDFLQDIAKWLIIGILLAAVIGVAVPDDYFTGYIESTWLGMLVLLAASVPLYVCATGSVPIAAALMMKGFSPGAALVFLMAGPATNIATMTIIYKVFGKKTLSIYMISITAGALVFGAIINVFLPVEWFHRGVVAGEGSHLLPHWLKAASSVILALLLVNGLIQKYKYLIIKKKKTMEAKSIIVEGMTCKHCKTNVEKALMAIDGIRLAEADPASGRVEIAGKGINEAKLKEAIEKAGYSYKGNA